MTASNTGALRFRLESDLRAAMKARDRTSVSVLRSLIGAIDNAGAVESAPLAAPVVNRRADVNRKELTEDDVRDVVEREARELRTAVAAYDPTGQSAQIEELRAKLEVVERYIGA